MGYGILQMGQDTRKQALNGMGQADELEQQREAENQQLEAQKTAQRQQEQGAFMGLNAAGLAMSIAAMF